MSVGSTDLAAMLRSMDAVVRSDEYVYAQIGTDHPVRQCAAALISEDEGLTAVLRGEDADAYGVTYDFVAAWITLTVHSSLEAVGLTAAFSQSLAAEGISCNVLAG
ncbi:ACT domain-containing protein, partial [Nesterenkonia muleiensis]|uniref:ACT domain-containing protein n=1 Tax=Nesterenkonia muleiensis TaxID=2282648 RepID=UPI000E729608